MTTALAPMDLDDALPVEQARAVLAKGSKSFSFAAHLLAADQWDDASRVYAFCRRVDDLADSDEPTSDRNLALDRVRAELFGLLPPDPAVAGFLEVSARRGIDRDVALALVEGCRSDLFRDVMPDDDRLLRYCYGVASTVGLMMCGVLDVAEDEALPFAVDLGIAMQLTNICRDVAEDAANGRVYLPATRLRAHGVEPADLVRGTADRAAVAAVVTELLDLAERYYASGWQGLRYLPVRARLAILVAGRVYRAIGQRLRRRGSDALAGRTVVPLAGKLAEAAVALVSFFRPGLLGLSAPRPHDAGLHTALSGLPGCHAS